MKDRTDTLFKVRFGSHLYGTATERSDVDYKEVYLPPLDDLLLNQRLTNQKILPEGHSHGDSMSAGEVENELIPLHVFMNDFFNGQTYALELAFAVLERKTEVIKERSYWYVPPDSLSGTVNGGGSGKGICNNGTTQMVRELVENFLTRNVKKMVGYAVAQSQNYGIRTNRLNALQKAVDLIVEYLPRTDFDVAHGHTDVLGEHTELIDRLCQSDPNGNFIFKTEILNAKGGTALAPALEIIEKQFSYTTRITFMLSSLQKTLREYGDRAKQFAGQGADWKALSHAIRITEQIIELCATGKLTFPRPNAAYLLAVKQGQVPLEEATAYLQDVFSRIDDAVANSVLRERTDELEEAFTAWKLKWLRSYYDLH